MKQSGLGDQLYVGAFNIAGDVGSVDRIGGGPQLLDVTGINASVLQRIATYRDASIEFTSFFNDAADGAHSALKGLPSTDVGVTYVRGSTLGNPCATLTAKQMNYDGTRGNDGSLTFKVQAMNASVGLEWGNLLTVGTARTDTTGTNPATGIDDLAGTPTSTNFGASIWVHLLTFSGTSVTFTLRDSADNSTFAAVAGGASTAMTAVGYQRWVTGSTQNIRRYLSIGTSGTFTNAVFLCGVTRHLTATL